VDGAERKIQSDGGVSDPAALCGRWAALLWMIFEMEGAIRHRGRIDHSLGFRSKAVQTDTGFSLA
jgi:hypothetical protein